MMWVVFILGIVAVCMMCVVYWKLCSRRLQGRARRKVMEAWVTVEMMDDVVKKILAADSVLHMVLDYLGYEGSVGEQLRAAGLRIPNINDVWQAHKLRNRVAHQAGAGASDAEARYAVDAIRKAIDAL